MSVQTQFLFVFTVLMTGVGIAFGQLAMSSQPPANLVADDPVSVARREYQVTLASLARVDRRLAELEADPSADPETLETYRNYRDRLAASAEAQREQLEKRGLPTVQAGPKIADQAEEAARVAPPVGPIAPPRMEDRVGDLDQKLGESMSEFDGVLMRKQQELAQEEAGEITETSAEASAAAEAEALLEQLEQNQGGQEGQAGQEGAEGSDGAESEMAGGGDEAGEEGNTEQEGEQMADAGSEGAEGSGEAGGEALDEEGAEGAEGVDIGGLASAGGEGSGGGEMGDGERTGFPGGADGEAGAETGEQAKPGPRYQKWAADDDIVARQLREAAEQETDPVLKEKLWKEYEAYKTGKRR